MDVEDVWGEKRKCGGWMVVKRLSDSQVVLLATVLATTQTRNFAVGLQSSTFCARTPLPLLSFLYSYKLLAVDQNGFYNNNAQTGVQLDNSKKNIQEKK